MKIFLIRHATPAWHRRDIPYDIHPGPMLTSKGEKEAEALAEFLRSQAVAKLYYSPFERGARTAAIVATANGIPSVEEIGLAEWRAVAEAESQVRQRMAAVFERAAQESAQAGPVGLVSHGGPIRVLLLELGMNHEELARYQTRFDTTNPLPPAGAWKVERTTENDPWRFQLAFAPNGTA